MTGSFCTSVLRTNDPGRAAQFYASLIGWTAVQATPAHAFLQFTGKTVASIQRVEQGHEGWVPHVLVDDIETVIADVTRLGGRLEDQHDIDGVARIATIRDLEGAAFGLWQADPHPGAGMTDVPGSIWWIEVLARDATVAREFYASLFGWTVRETSFEPFAMYRVFERPGNQEGGLLQIDPEWGEVPPCWTTIVAVDDADRTMSRACDLGGKSVFVHTVPKHGRIGSILDPGGAYLVLRSPVPAATA